MYSSNTTYVTGLTAIIIVKLHMVTKPCQHTNAGHWETGTRCSLVFPECHTLAV